MMQDKDKLQYSPMIRQYLEIKEQYPDMLLFYRVGDFYEMFFQDALVGSKALEIVLTGKDGGAKDKIPMCGVPHHSVAIYIDMLTSQGFKVGIVDQVEDPKFAKGIVKREVTRIITPGTIIEPESLEAKENNYILSLTKTMTNYVVSYVDMSTGEGYVTMIPLDSYLLFTEIINLNAREIIISSEQRFPELQDLQTTYPLTISIEDNTVAPMYFKALIQGLDKDEEMTYCRLLNYITRTQMRTLIHLQKVMRVPFNSYLKIDLSSRRNLELLETLRFQNKRNTLFHVLDRCCTAMGSRYLKKTILFPYIDSEKIQNRYDVIERMKKHPIEMADLTNILDDVYDLERIVGRISYANANPKDMLQLKRSLKGLPILTHLIKTIGIASAFDLTTDAKAYHALFELIDSALDEDAPFSTKAGNVIKRGYHAELDELRLVNRNSKDYILSLEVKERERTGIKQLKIGFNKVFGYYIEVSKLNSELIRDDFGYVRKQTLSNAERYITQE